MHLFYSDTQNRRDGCQQGKIATGEYVKYTLATQEKEIDGTLLGLNDLVYVGEGTHVSSLKDTRRKGFNIDSGKVITSQGVRKL